MADCAEVHDVPVRLECLLVHPDARLPLRKRVTDAGHDIASVVDIVVPPHGAVNVDTGIIVVAPEGWYLTVEGRSSMWMRGVAPFRGVIDGGYTGGLMVAMMNVSDNSYQIQKGDRIAQIILHKIQHFDLAVVNSLSPEYCIRGTNGFGSSGR
jgi:dUTP pyrophosphatase